MSTSIRGMVCLTLALGLVTASTPAGAEEFQRRWDQPETPFEDRNMAAKIGSNVRDGLWGVVDSLGQGAFSLVGLLSPYGGVAIRKISTLVGDVVGLVDNNPATRFVFRGILSRQFLRFVEEPQ